MFHAGREFKLEHAESFQGVAPSRVESPSRLACPNQRSERQASFHFPHVSCAEPRPGHGNQFRLFTGVRAPLENPLHVQVLTQTRTFRSILVFVGRPGPAQKPFACPSLNPDQDMPLNFGFLRAPGPRSKALCMSKSGHASQFWFSLGARAPLKNPLHVQV